jgi:hypothetical protein
MKNNAMQSITIPVLSNERDGVSAFIEESYKLEDYNGLFITGRMDAQNFRHRHSKPGYFSSWHVAGDATLIIIRAGTLRISLRDESFRDFSAGDMFVAKDRLREGEIFNDQMHGHTAQLIGSQDLYAVHIKLSVNG